MEPRTYRSYDQLIGNSLIINDKVIFKVKDKSYTYTCNSGKHFFNSVGLNDVIFRVLNLDKIAFCKKAYGYEPISGGFPECNDGDYVALKAVALALFRECEKFNSNIGPSRDLFESFINSKKIFIRTTNDTEFQETQNILFYYGYKWVINGKKLKKGRKYSYISAEIKDKKLRHGDGNPKKYPFITYSELLKLNYSDKDSQPKPKTNTKTNGRVLNIRTKKITISRGERPEGKSIRSRKIKASIRCGHLRDSGRALKG